MLHLARTETGLRLVVAALALATLSIGVLRSAFQSLANSFPNSVFVDVVLPVGWALLGATAVLGGLGVSILERNRRRSRAQGGPRWDAPRLAAIGSVVAGAFAFFPGLVAGFVYVPQFQWLVSTLSITGRLVFSVSTGLYLFLIARRIHGFATPLGRLALVIGLVAAGTAAALDVVMDVGLFSEDSRLAVFAITMGYVIAALGVCSLVAWIVLYSSILGRMGSRAETSMAVDRGLTL